MSVTDPMAPAAPTVPATTGTEAPPSADGVRSAPGLPTVDPCFLNGRRSRAGGGEKGLVGRASRGDVGAFSELVRIHSDFVRRVALRTLGGEDAQDACQEVWAKVWANIRGFRGESTFTTWLYRITVNTCLNLRQKESRREKGRHGGEVPQVPEPAGGDADPEASTLGHELREEVRSALNRVREEHRAALVLRHMEGLSYAEIAEKLGVPDGTAKGWVSRGRTAMIVALAEEKRAREDAASQGLSRGGAGGASEPSPA